jgi:DNA replication protein DnaC
MWKPEHGSVLVLGPSGVGKTAAAAFLVRRLSEAAVESCARAASSETPELDFAARILWTTGAALIVARREHALGVGEPPALWRAKTASLLVLDELGHESGAADPVLLEVIDHRYAQRSPTIVTSGLTRIEFVARYGDALFRRLTEHGVLVEAHV